MWHSGNTTVSVNMSLEYWLGLIFFSVGFIYYALHQHYDYWRRRKVPEVPGRFIIGNMASMLSLRTSPADFISELYNNSNALDQPFVGIHVFHRPAILLRDPALIKRIMIKDFPKFSNRYSNSDPKSDPLGSQNLFFLKNPEWKNVRLKLSPFFTSTKLKHMFVLIDEVGCNLDAYLRNMPLHNEKTRSFNIEVKELSALFTTDVIATCAYGVQANSFKQLDSEFRRHGKAVFEFSLKRAMEFTFFFFLPHLAPYLGFKVVPAEATKFLRNTINYVIAERERTGATRNDLIDILIDFKRSTKQAQAIGDQKQFVFEGDILVAQAVLFFTAGFESSSSTMAFTLYELAKNAQVQERLREEIKQALIITKGQVTLKLIEKLEYMQMILYEVLRLYPPLPFLDRECTSETAYPLSPFHEFCVPPGMPIYIPVYALHLDPQYFPQPRQFLPERFSAANRKHQIPYTYMPFGLGPHGCIGERFGLLQAKVGLTYLLRNHLVTTSERTPHRMKLDPKAIILQSEGGINLKLVRDPLGV